MARTIGTDHAARRRAHIGGLDATQARRLYRRLVGRLDAIAAGDPFGWDVPTMRALGHGELLDAANECANRVNHLEFPVN